MYFEVNCMSSKWSPEEEEKIWRNWKELICVMTVPNSRGQNLRSIRVNSWKDSRAGKLPHDHQDQEGDFSFAVLRRCIAWSEQDWRRRKYTSQPHLRWSWFMIAQLIFNSDVLPFDSIVRVCTKNDSEDGTGNVKYYMAQIKLLRAEQGQKSTRLHDRFLLWHGPSLDIIPSACTCKIVSTKLSWTPQHSYFLQHVIVL